MERKKGRGDWCGESFFGHWLDRKSTLNLHIRLEKISRPRQLSLAGLDVMKRQAAMRAPKAGKRVKAVKSETPNVLYQLPKYDIWNAVMVRRPSSRNRSPYVADVMVKMGGGEEKLAVAHVPSMELGGKCIPEAELLVQTARDRKGNAVTENDTGKYGTPKCQYITRLCKVSEEECKRFGVQDGKVWVGAHPSIGESIAEKLLQLGATYLPLHTEPIKRVSSQVSNFAGTRSRLDFLVEFTDGHRCAVEVKTVVDTDYDPRIAQPAERMFLGPKDCKVYRRAAIFPWGRSKQKGPDGEPVVSARAIEHVNLLADIARGKRTHGIETDDGKQGKLDVALLFIVVRQDAELFRPNAEACPSFAKYLRAARNAGVKVLAHKVRWGLEDDQVGSAFCAGPLPVELD